MSSLAALCMSTIPRCRYCPGTGKTKTSRLWIYVRDERPFGGSRKPAALFFYSPDRKGEHPQAHLKDFRSVIHACAQQPASTIRPPANSSLNPA
jgi:hypothetical protein